MDLAVNSLSMFVDGEMEHEVTPNFSLHTYNIYVEHITRTV